MEHNDWRTALRAWARAAGINGAYVPTAIEDLLSPEPPERSTDREEYADFVREQRLALNEWAKTPTWVITTAHAAALVRAHPALPAPAVPTVTRIGIDGPITRLEWVTSVAVGWRDHLDNKSWSVWIEGAHPAREAALDAFLKEGQ